MGSGRSGGSQAAKRAYVSGGSTARSAVSRPDHNVPPADFAARVHDAAMRVHGPGRFGDNKVFINHAQAEYEKAHGAIPLGEFKARLTALNQSRHLDLSRADLVEAMNPADVAASNVTHYGAQYNFIKIR